MGITMVIVVWLDEEWCKDVNVHDGCSESEEDLSDTVVIVFCSVI